MTGKFAALPLAFALFSAQAAFAAVTAEQAERISPGLVAVTWSDKAPVDVYMADRPDAAMSEAKLVADDNRKGRIEVPADPADRPYFILVDTKDGARVRLAERVLPLDQGSNFRDLGGYPAASGKHVRWGRIYRSGGTPMLSEADLAKIADLGLKDLVDLRSSEERVLAPTRIEGVRYTAVGYSMARIRGQTAAPGTDEYMHEVYRVFPTMLAPQIRIVFEDLLAGDGPLVFNCSAGQDRTGFTTAILLTALGVPREVIYADYHLSTTYRRPQFEMPHLDVAAQPNNPAVQMFAGYQRDPAANKPKPLYDSQQHALLEFALAEVETRWGSVEAYLDKELGVSAEDITKLRAMYLE